MRGYFTMSEDEKNSILQQHSGFYNGYSTGNVPSTPQPLKIDKGPTDTQGITVNNKGSVGIYKNHLVNEQKINKKSNSEYDNKFDEDEVNLQNEEEQCEGCNESEIEEIDIKDLKKGEKYKYFTHPDEVDVNYEYQYDYPDSSSTFLFSKDNISYLLNQKSVEDLISKIENSDEMDGELYESLNKEKKKIIDMFDRFKNFN
jgi:hypothetical protein